MKYRFQGGIDSVTSLSVLKDFPVGAEKEQMWNANDSIFLGEGCFRIRSLFLASKAIHCPSILASAPGMLNRRAAESLEEKELILKTPSLGETVYEVYDVFFSRWLEQTY